mmetsp:Transcript_28843/g.112349  ORF Transcript_28843/g.112349 Transcript_28843/m.112349 type:complete len:215 (+) Transcript_28843:364-1008(+)
MCQFPDVYLAQIEDLLVCKKMYGLQVANYCPLREVFDVRICGHDRLKFRRDIKHLVSLHRHLLCRQFRSVQLTDKLALTSEKKQSSFPGRGIPGSSTNAMYICRKRFWTINLNHPVHSWKVQTSRGYVGGEQTSCLIFAKVSIGGCSLLQFHPTEQMQERYSRPHPSQCFIEESNLADHAKGKALLTNRAACFGRYVPALSLSRKRGFWISDVM